MPDSSAEKTEKATPRKRNKARKEGQVRKSTDVNTAVTLSVAFAALLLLGGTMLNRMFSMLYSYIGGDAIPRGTLTHNDITRLFSGLIRNFLETVLPMLLVAVVIGIAINLLQVGFLFTSKTIKPKFSKINPLSGFKRLFSMRTLIELVKSVIKISVVGYIIYQEYLARFPEFPNFMNYSLSQVASEIFNICISLAIKACLALIVIGAMDFLYQWFDFEKNLKMTKQEVKDEYKMVEGDPKIKAKIKEQQRKMSAMRMMSAVPQADVVITNPTHYAVAIKYDEKLGNAPVVLAKGTDYTAQKIKEKAQEAGVPIIENKPVAQALYAAAEVGDQIPADLFAAVAEILARVYKAKQERRYVS